nr:MAG TPA: hypothetical protein [Caudoviricetes sp.]
MCQNVYHAPAHCQKRQYFIDFFKHVRWIMLFHRRARQASWSRFQDFKSHAPSGSYVNINIPRGYPVTTRENKRRPAWRRIRA